MSIEDPKNKAVEDQEERDKADGNHHEGGPGQEIAGGRTPEQLEQDKDQEGDAGADDDGE